jgi:thioredoxin reductase
LDAAPEHDPPIDPSDPYEREAQTFPQLKSVVLTRRASGESETLKIVGMFVMIGAAPNTGWLDGSTKSVVSAVGEASVGVSGVHRFLETRRG